MTVATQRQIAVAVKQAGGKILPANATHRNRIQIRSASSSRLYTVAQRKNSDQWECSCPGWVFKRPGKSRTCKHLKTMRPLLEAQPQRPQLKG